MMRQTVKRAQGFTTQYSPMSTPLGKGTVVPMKFDTIKPNYHPQSAPVWGSTFYIWNMSNWFNSFLVSAVFIWGIKGGFAGHLPPDPKKLWP